MNLVLVKQVPDWLLVRFCSDVVLVEEKQRNDPFFFFPAPDGLKKSENMF